MTPLEIVSQLEGREYEHEGEVHKVKLQEPLDEYELEDIVKMLPTHTFPPEIDKLVAKTSGISSKRLEIDLDSFHMFDGEKELFPYSLNLAVLSNDNEADAIVDINPISGDWEEIWTFSDANYFIFKWSKAFTHFLAENLKIHLKDVHNQEEEFEIAYRKMNETRPIRYSEALAMDTSFSDFAKQLEEDFTFYDLREAQLYDGFSWKHLGGDAEIVRHPTEKIWALRKKIKKKSFLQKLFRL